MLSKDLQQLADPNLDFKKSSKISMTQLLSKKPGLQTIKKIDQNIKKKKRHLKSNFIISSNV